MGFTLVEIKELLSLRANEATRCSDVRTRVEAKMASIEGKASVLLAMRESLAQLVEQCPGDAPVSICPIIESFDSENGG
jgi:MerR family mercuric resistance operon transcriptional regulator